jgi:hypothetical protein
MGTGAKWDKDYMLNGIKIDGKPNLIPFPPQKSEIRNFIDQTGTLDTLLKQFYPNHKFTRDFFND